MHAISFDKLITNRRNLERILDNLKEGIIAHDMHRRILFFNQEAERVTGLRREDILGKDCHAVFDRPFCGDNCSFCSDKPDIGEKKEYSLNIKNRQGDVRRIEMSITPMTDEQGRMFGVLASFRDNTDLFCLRMKAEAEIGFSSIIGQDNKMLQVFQQIRDVADYDYPVHITGETGTGKELVALAIHNESRRKGGPFVPINCGALPEGLLESELFGHVKGSFSGAVRDKKGRFELADNGTIFLDEVADLTKRTQVKLLRFLQEGSFERVGDEKTVKVNVRVISATNKNLWQEVRSQHFRDDLYYRLNVIPIRIPALRERKTDIPLLVNHFLNEAANHDGQTLIRISKAALSRMMDYGWPGNVREMQNAIQYAIVKCKGDLIQPADLPLELQPVMGIQARRGPARKLDTDKVSQALITAGGNKAKAARILGVGRATLYRFLKEYPQ